MIARPSGSPKAVQTNASISRSSRSAARGSVVRCLRLASAMIDVARDAGVAVVDEREFLLRRVDRVAASELFVDHCHPTAAGHRSIAAAIDAVLSPLLETR